MVLAFPWPEPAHAGTLHVDFVVVIRREAKAYVENRLSTFANILHVYSRY
jgi:hypothetical protein